MAYPSFEVTNTFVNGNTADADEVNANFTDVETMVDGASAIGTPATIGMVPIGSIVAWHKTFTTISSGTADTNTVDKLVDSGATFSADGVTAGMIIHNTTDDTFGIVSAVDSETSISIKADSNGNSAVTDVFPDGNENYVIYATPELPDNWLECNGQAVSDADSPFNGATLPTLNGSTESTKRFLRGSTVGSGSTGGGATHNHLWTGDDGSQHTAWIGNIDTDAHTYDSSGNAKSMTIAGGNNYTNKVASDPPYYMEMVWIFRIK